VPIESPRGRFEDKKRLGVTTMEDEKISVAQEKVTREPEKLNRREALKRMAKGVALLGTLGVTALVTQGQDECSGGYSNLYYNYSNSGGGYNNYYNYSDAFNYYNYNDSYGDMYYNVYSNYDDTYSAYHNTQYYNYSDAFNYSNYSDNYSDLYYNVYDNYNDTYTNY
jgi:hypothetical protein